jgi:hypothetical protein
VQPIYLAEGRPRQVLIYTPLTALNLLNNLSQLVLFINCPALQLTPRADKVIIKRLNGTGLGRAVLQGFHLYMAAALLGLLVCLGGAAGAQEAGDKNASETLDRTPSSAPGESYLEQQKKKEALEPFQPGRTPGLPDYGDNLGGEAPRSGSAMGRSAPKPLPSLLDPQERRKKRFGLQQDSALPERPSPKTSRPDMATSRLSRERVYRVSYTGDKPNSYGVPFSWQVKLEDTNGLPIKGAKLKLRLSMPQSGYAPVISGIAVKEVGGGLYKISGLRCDRPGIWRAALEVHGRGYGDVVDFNLQVP